MTLGADPLPFSCTSTSTTRKHGADDATTLGPPPAAAVEDPPLAPTNMDSTTPSSTPKGTLDVLFLGTGVSIAVPNMGHVLQEDCAICLRAHSEPTSKDRRNNVSIAVLVNGTGEGPTDTNRDCILVDAGKTMRDSILRRFPAEGIKSVQTLLLTHDHADATFGLDDLRDLQKKEHVEGSGIRLVDPPIDVFLQRATYATIKKQFAYLVSATPWIDESRRLLLRNVPVLAWHPLSSDDAELHVTASQVPVRTFPVLHGGDYVSLGFTFGRPGEFVYISDVKLIPPSSLAFLQSLPPIQTLVLDCISTASTLHYSHFNMAEALATVDLLKPRQAYLTGMCCEVGNHEELNERLLKMGYPHVSLAWDGMVVRGVKM
ncbi:hypothetical protein VYU27_006202 [Nannochloropsis oceanica]